MPLNVVTHNSKRIGFLRTIDGTWIVQLTKYDFRGAVGHLVASIPRIHNHNTRYPLDSMHFLSSIRYSFSGMKEALGFTPSGLLSHNMEILEQMDYSLE
ncbi:hypothetical protein HHK36_022184 [Tetracentron sinense]|uniref:Uncharacterized protein n=1 Tax=Tetracentron sinense TaxID=13715 RepID=A0A835D6I8_TETSI|nr:hypothetical protein HHK36_022184 [Tetracentron sinense]